jgi:hypothetical protein
MKDVFMTLFAGLVIGIALVISVIIGSDLDRQDISRIIINHPRLSIAGIMSFAIIFCTWRMHEMHPDWRLEERFKAFVRRFRNG